MGLRVEKTATNRMVLGLASLAAMSTTSCIRVQNLIFLITLYCLDFKFPCHFTSELAYSLEMLSPMVSSVPIVILMYVLLPSLFFFTGKTSHCPYRNVAFKVTRVFYC